MDWANVVTLLVAIIAALAAYASQRSASKATTINTTTSTRLDMEREAYERARKFDIETIARQDHEIDELRADNRDLHEKVAVARREAREARADARSAQAENRELRERIAILERGRINPPNSS